MFNRGFSVALPYLLQFGQGLGDVDDKRHSVFQGDFVCPRQEIRAAREQGVGLNRYGNNRVLPPLLDQRFRVFETPAYFPVVGGREIVEDLACQAPHAGDGGGTGHLILKQVHVAEGGGAGKDHLGAGQQGARMDKIGIHPGLSREDITVQPFHEGKIVREAPEQAHGSVGMPVYETRQDQPAVGVDHLWGLSRLLQIPNVGYGIAVD